MLLGEDFGWRHNRRLKAISGGLHRRGGRHDGLARTDIAFEK